MTKPNPSRGLKILLPGIAVLLLMLGTPRPTLAETILPDVQTLCTPLEIKSGDPQEAPCIKQLKAVAQREGGKLTLKLNNGKTKVLSDPKACEGGIDADCFHHRLVGSIADQQFIIHLVGFEWAGVLLVSQATGAETRLENWPHLSPGKKRFVAVTASDAGDIKTAIAVFSIASDPPRLEWSYPNPKEYESYDFDGWDGDNRVRLRVLTTGGTATDTDVKRTAQGWQLKRPNGELSLGVPGQANPRRPVGQPANAAAPMAPPSR
jgi:hypothetical protein